jgi:hypothetical protein
VFFLLERCLLRPHWPHESNVLLHNTNTRATHSGSRGVASNWQCRYCKLVSISCVLEVISLASTHSVTTRIIKTALFVGDQLSHCFARAARLNRHSNYATGCQPSSFDSCMKHPATSWMVPPSETTQCSSESYKEMRRGEVWKREKSKQEAERHTQGVVHSAVEFTVMHARRRRYVTARRSSRHNRTSALYFEDHHQHYGAQPVHSLLRARLSIATRCRRCVYQYPCFLPFTPTCPSNMVVNRPMCQVIMYSQNGESREGPVGNLASSVPICEVSAPKREVPLKAPTGIAEGTVHLYAQCKTLHKDACLRWNRDPLTTHKFKTFWQNSNKLFWYTCGARAPPPAILEVRKHCNREPWKQMACV